MGNDYPLSAGINDKTECFGAIYYYGYENRLMPGNKGNTGSRGH